MTSKASGCDLSVLIPSRNEEWLSETVADLLKNIRGNTEIIVVLDGEVFPKPLPEDPRLTVIRHHESRGQRASTNDAARVARGKYYLKADAHTAWDEGFDVKLLQTFKDLGDNVTVVPIMRNLWVYDWKCYKDGKRTYQDKGNICPDCGSEMKKKFLWIAKPNPQSVSYCFDSEPHFQYFNDYKKTEKYKEELKTGYTETMSLQGSAFCLSAERYWALNIGDESFGSWGSQGIQLACSTWLSGGRCIVNHSTWYAHLFRTKGELFGFPYPISGSQTEAAKARARNKLYQNNWPHQIHPTSWLIERFKPIKGWHDDSPASQEALAAINKAGEEFNGRGVVN